MEVGVMSRGGCRLISQVLVGDDAFRLSTVAFDKDQEGNDTPPQIVAQHQTAGKAGNMWAGAVQVNGYVLSPRKAFW